MLTKNLSSHDSRDEGCAANIRLAQEQFGCGGLGSAGSRGQSYLGGKGEGGKGVHDKIDPEHLHSSQGALTDSTCTDESNGDRNNVHGELEDKKLGDAVVDVAAPADGLNDAAKVVVRNDDV